MAVASTRSRRSLRAKVRRLTLVLERTLGVPRPQQRRSPPLDMLVATILSQNTNDRNSYQAYTQLRRRYPAWEMVARAPLHQLTATIRSGGMARQKGRRIRAVLRHIERCYGGFTLEPLRALNSETVMKELTVFHGVGVKTAACVLLFSFGRDVFPVDTHIHRICGRLGLTPGARTPEQTFRGMATLVPEGKAYSLHTNLIRFGRSVCRAGTPRCPGCPLVQECAYERKISVLPTNGRSSTSRRDFMLLDHVDR